MATATPAAISPVQQQHRRYSSNNSGQYQRICKYVAHLAELEPELECIASLSKKINEKKLKIREGIKKAN